MAKYLKHDCEQGFVDDSREIEYLKFNNLRHTSLGYMLGEFNENGEYVVDPEIVKELIGLKKYIVENIDNLDICVSELKLDKQISFLVTFEGECATLSLIERLSYEANFETNSGKYSNINEYILDQVETSGVVNKTYFYKRWNISETSGEQLDVFNMDEETLASLFGIVNRFKQNIAANILLLEKEEELEEVEAEYSTQIFAILEKYPKLKKVVVEEVKKSFTESPELIRIDKPNFAKTLNEVIENAIAVNLDVLGEEKESFLTEQREAKQQYSVKVQETLEIVEVNEQKNAEFSKKKSIFNLHEAEHQDVKTLASKLVKTEAKVEKRLQNDAVTKITKKANEPESKLSKAIAGVKDEENKPIVSKRKELLDRIEKEITTEKVTLEDVAVGEETKKEIAEIKEELKAKPAEKASTVKKEPAKAPSSAAPSKGTAKKPAVKKAAPAKKAPAAAPKPAAAAPAPKTAAKAEPKKEGKTTTGTPVYYTTIGSALLRQAVQEKKAEQAQATTEQEQAAKPSRSKKTTKTYGSALAVTEEDRNLATLEKGNLVGASVEPLVSGGAKVELPKSKDFKQVEKEDQLGVSDLTK